jgi:carboxylesterase type B
VPGNAAIFDQIEALRWVNKFVEHFGGDPNQITIVGESAGSASVTLLLLAPQTRGFTIQLIILH